jgi:hypothetical protein
MIIKINLGRNSALNDKKGLQGCSPFFVGILKTINLFVTLSKEKLLAKHIDIEIDKLTNSIEASARYLIDRYFNK